MTQASIPRALVVQPAPPGVYFKPAPGGYVFRAPKARMFGPTEHFLVSETQRDEIIAILAPTRPDARTARRKLIAGLAAVIVTFSLVVTTIYLGLVVHLGFTSAFAAVATFLPAFAVLLAAIVCAEFDAAVRRSRADE